MDSVPQFYVYVLARPNGKPFYVGKGKGGRVYDHEKEARSGHRCHKCNVIRKIWKQGGQVQRYIVFATSDEQEAYQHEKDLIALYGRKTLCNRTDGGDAPPRVPMTDEHKDTLRKINRKRMEDPEQREQWIQSVQRSRGSDASRAKTSEQMRQRWQELSPEQRTELARKTGESQKGKFVSDETRRRISVGKKGKRHSAATVAKRRGRAVSEETRRKMSEAHKRRIHRRGFTHSEETRKKMSLSQREYQSAPEFRKRRAELSRAMWADPEKRERIITARRLKYRGKREFVLRDPDGITHITDNLTQFCREHGLNYGAMYAVLCGKNPHRKSYRGWSKGDSHPVDILDIS